MTDKKVVSFRHMVNFMTTTYATHGLYMYPAKFIPHVVRYAIEKYTRPGDWVFDPFAGYGTVAIEASLTGRNAVLWDLNPITEVLTLASTYRGDISLRDFEIDWEYDTPLKPLWDNIEYWHPPEFLEALSKLWGYWHREVYSRAKTKEELQKAYLIAIPLLKVTRYFSYSDEKISKLYKSKYAKEKVRMLLSTDWKTKMVKMYWRHASRVLDKILEFQRSNPCDVEIVVKTSKRVDGKLVVWDSLSERLDRTVDLLITSPPYFQAQEYIRSFKLELAWLGYTGEEIRMLASYEIPYRTEFPNTDVGSSLYKKYREIVAGLGSTKLLRIYESYFKSLAHFFNENAHMCKVIAVFVGECKVRDIKIPVDDILKEHLETLRFKHEETLVDNITARRIFKFKNDINPVTKVKSERMAREYLLTVVTHESK